MGKRHRVVGATALAMFLLAVTACIPQPPPGRGPNPTLTVSSAVTGLDHPWDVAFASAPGTGTWMIYTERFGRVSAKPLNSGAPVVLGQLGAPFVANGEGGLLGLAVDPEFSTNRFVYACYTTTSDVRLVRFRVSTFTAGALAFDGDVVTGMPVNPSGRHSGCRPRFRPGTNPPQLFVGTGDSASNGTIPQDLQSLGGKVLCVGRDGSPCAGNPGLGDPGIDDRVHSWGHRNVQGIAFTPGGGGYSIEHGPDRDDEVNVLVPGDFGWNPDPPGSSTAYDESQPMTRAGAIGAAWRSGASTIAPSGATVLSGAQWEGWNRALAMAVLKGRELRVVFFDDLIGFSAIGETFELRGAGRLRSAVQGPDGNLYITTDNGSMNDQILKVVPS
jgi:glucose/arabinose dehydrogenase